MQDDFVEESWGNEVDLAPENILKFILHTSKGKTGNVFWIESD